MASLLCQRHLLRSVNHLTYCWQSSAMMNRRSLSGCIIAASLQMHRKKTPVPSSDCVSRDRETWTLWCGRVPSRFSHMSSIIDRGVYDQRMNQHVKGCDVKKLELMSDGKILSISWDDGKVSKFHSVWLRFNCFCPKCRIDHTGQLSVTFDQAPVESRLLAAEDDGQGCVSVQWGMDPGHTGVFPLQFLKAHCYSRESLDHRRQTIAIKHTTEMVIPRVKYDEVMNSRRGVYTWLKMLNEKGVSVVEGMPCKEDSIMEVCQRIADIIQHTIYGETFDVKTVPMPINAAYGSGELKLHMDQIMYEAPPGLQALHCIKFEETMQGGDNVFVDLFHIAETFREKHPQDFQLLCEVPITYETLHYNRDWPVHMRYSRPLFRLNRLGDLIGVVWHPNLLGPLQVEEELVEPVYSALIKFSTLINNFPHVYQYRPKVGQMVIFNNRRMLHGRSAFDSQVGERHLRGCYVEISEFKSCLHVLSNLEGDGSPPIRVGDFDCV